MSVRRHWILACLALALGLAGCGHKSAHPHVADANNIGGYVDANYVTYQLQISRELNQYEVTDSQYVRGLPLGTAPLTADQEWYGVFMWAKNQTDKPQTTTDNFDIVDTQGNHYYPLKLNTALNPYAWTSQVLEPLQTEPFPGTTASFGPTQGGLLLFKINSSVYANRPLTLEIRGPGGRLRATISLDL